MNQTIILKIHDEPCVQVPNSTAQSDLSIAALGALTRMCSYSNAYQFKTEWLEKNFGVGRDKLKSILRELRDKGFLKITPNQNDEGVFCGQTWHLSVKPVFNRSAEKPYDGSAVVRENRSTENPHRYKKEESIKKEENKKKEEARSAPAATATTGKKTNLATNTALSEAEENVFGRRAVPVREFTNEPPTVETICRFYPGARLNHEQSKLLAEITDLNVWNDTVQWWSRRGYQWRNVEGLIDKYRQNLNVAKQPTVTQTSGYVLTAEMLDQREAEYYAREAKR